MAVKLSAGINVSINEVKSDVESAVRMIQTMAEKK